MSAKEIEERGYRELLDELKKSGLFSEEGIKNIEQFSETMIIATDHLYELLRELSGDDNVAAMIVETWIRIASGAVGYLLAEARRIERLYNAPRRIAFLIAHEHLVGAHVIQLIQRFVENELAWTAKITELRNRELYR